jgi:hypothetical protein
VDGGDGSAYHLYFHPSLDLHGNDDDICLIHLFITVALPHVFLIF